MTTESTEKLRVAVVAPDYPDSFGSVIAHEFKLLGHQACVIPSYPSWVSNSKLVATVASLFETKKHDVPQAVDRQILKRLEAFDPDLVVTTEANLGPARISRWRRVAPRARLALWYPDAIVNLGAQSAFCANYDRIYTKDRYLFDRLHYQGGVGEIRHLPEGCRSDLPAEWARAPSPAEREEFGNSVAIVGNVYPSRDRLLRALPSDIPLDIYGNVTTKHPSDRVLASYREEYVVMERKARVFRCSAAVLNNLHYGEVGGLNSRAFEAAAAGALLVVDSLPHVVEYFEPGKEIVVFKDLRELEAVLRQALSDENEEIRQAARARVLAEHTMAHRLEAMIEDLQQ